MSTPFYKILVKKIDKRKNLRYHKPRKQGYYRGERPRRTPKKEEEYPMTFGQQLRARRESLGLSRAALAERLGVTVSAIGNYETGVSFPKEEVLLRLFNALHTDPNRLFSGSYRAQDFELTSSERELIETCRTLSPLARQTVRSMADALCAYRDELTEERAVRRDARLIPLYASPAAAGYAAPVPDEDFTYISVDETVPHGADFAVRIQGDSMEPHIADGSTVYVNRDPLADGDVGIFCVDGTMLCKQYHRDPLGVVYLFSLNRARADADVVLTPTGARSLVCFGRVMLPRRLPLAAL